MNNNTPIIPDNSGGNSLFLLFSITDFEGIPILFVARNSFNELFLCNCIEFRFFQRWIISKVTIPVLDDVINCTIPIWDALKIDNGLKIIATFFYNSGKFIQEKVPFDSIPIDDLPEKNAYACLINKNAKQNLSLLHTLLSADFLSEDAYTTHIEADTISHENQCILQSHDEYKPFYAFHSLVA